MRITDRWIRRCPFFPLGHILFIANIPLLVQGDVLYRIFLLFIAVLIAQAHQRRNLCLFLLGLVGEVHPGDGFLCAGIPAGQFFAVVGRAVGIAGLDEVDPVGIDDAGHVVILTGVGTPHPGQRVVGEGQFRPVVDTGVVFAGDLVIKFIEIGLMPLFGADGNFECCSFYCRSSALL